MIAQLMHHGVPIIDEFESRGDLQPLQPDLGVGGAAD
jgi:hypothetical protein